MDECDNCKSENPVGGLRPAQRGGVAVKLCEICQTTAGATAFLAGGSEKKELIVIVQCMNLLRKDLATALAGLATKKGKP